MATVAIDKGMAIYQVVFNFATYLLIIVFIAKAIKTYFLMREGDNEQNPIQLVIGMLKAVIIMICFREIYTIGVGIVEEFLNAILTVINIENTNLAQALTNNIQVLIVLETIKTNENGEATTKRLPIDQEYTIQESKTLQNYVLSDKKETVTLTQV